MTLGERIRICRQRAGMSQEKVAELVGVSRQAVTKWEVNQSAPNTENLFKLAEVLGTTVDMLLVSEDENKAPLAEERKAAIRKERRKRNVRAAVLAALGYMGIYLLGRFFWCDMARSSVTGWLFTAKPAGAHSYLYGWLLSSGLFWWALVLSVIAALFGKYKFSCVTLSGFLLGLIAGMIFGPHPEGAATGHTHYGWLIWGVMYLISVAAGVLAEKNFLRSPS